MADSRRILFLSSALATAETKLKLATARMRWRDAVTHAEEAAAIDDELKALRAAEEQPARRVTVRG